ncbi:hypothetical protein [Flavihumibacter fluvii]|uniref:hypothetical protein n=1 Tax=Flavihumibacter fluvii TaxID=2838157 RepID=UPI001BDF578A|nr:hypothetical protein [Flavihumibacter fluvii]ULQ52970.1 hypothetical protein KJS93_01400 [Flavihumibacter fluvii]
MHILKKNLPAIILAGMALGTPWAIRGSFGHEQGAAWAGGIGALGVLLLAKRGDWYNRFLTATMASAAGWGIGGIISYGMVVGYGRGIDFGNVYYGLSMLLVIGGLFGWIGGGLFGLALSDRPGNKVQWPALIVEMTCGGLIFYFFIIREFEWLMTPPRGEEWAACLGMSFALTWYLFRNKHHAAIRVAVFSALGAGFGFAFGNFLQVMGNSAGLHFINLWNVMEYSIGFFGGCGMAYGTFSAAWEQPATGITKQQGSLPFVFLTLIIPFIVWDQAFNVPPDDTGTVVAGYIKWGTLGLVLLFSGFYTWKYFEEKKSLQDYGFNDVFRFFMASLVTYTIFHLLNSDVLANGFSLEQGLYLLNLAILLFLLPKVQGAFFANGLNPGKWVGLLLLLLILLAVLAFIAIHSHGSVPNMKIRFP